MLLTFSILIIFLWQVFNSIYTHLEFVLLAVVLIIYGLKYRIRIPDIRALAVLFGVHTIVCMLGGTLDSLNFINQLLSVLVSFLLYYNIVDRYSIEQIMKRYCVIAFWFSVFGLMQEFFAVLGNYTLLQLFFLVKDMKLVFILGPIVRIEGLCSEPYNFAILLLPAAYCALRCLSYNERIVYSRIQAVVVLLAFMLTFSGAGLVCFGAAVLLVMSDKNRRGTRFKMNHIVRNTALVIIVSTVFVFFYKTMPMIAWRVDDTIDALVNGREFEKYNMSTYAIMSNATVTMNMIKATMGIGVGFGSYGKNFHRFSEGLDTAFYAYGINYRDASNLTLRIAAETGILGLLLLLWFLIKYRKNVLPEKRWISDAAFLSLLIRLVRLGNYTMFGLGLFVCIYISAGSIQESVKQIELNMAVIGDRKYLVNRTNIKEEHES